MLSKETVRIIIGGNIPEITKVIKDKSFKINDRDMKGQSLLYHAYNKKLLNVCKILLDNGANVNITDWDNATLLYFACKNDDIKMVELLLQYNPNCNIPHVDHTNDECMHIGGDFKQHHNYTPFHVACMYSSVDIIKLLYQRVRCMIDFNSTVGYNRTLLQLAIMSRRRCEVVPLLLEYGANVDGIDSCVPLVNSVNTGDIEIVKILIANQAEIDKIQTVNSKNRSTALINACYGVNKNSSRQKVRYFDIVKLLLENKANPNLNVQGGGTPLENACKCYTGEHIDNEIVQILLEYGANANKYSKFGSPIHLATGQFGNIETVKLLLQYGADANFCCKQTRRTPFLNSCEQNNIEITELLLSPGYKVQINAVDYRYRNAVYWACVHNNYEMANLLLSHGVDKPEEPFKCRSGSKDTRAMRKYIREWKPPLQKGISSTSSRGGGGGGGDNIFE